MPIWILSLGLLACGLSSVWAESRALSGVGWREQRLGAEATAHSMEASGVRTLLGERVSATRGDLARPHMPQHPILLATWWR